MTHQLTKYLHLSRTTTREEKVSLWASMLRVRFLRSNIFFWMKYTKSTPIICNKGKINMITTYWNTQEKFCSDVVLQHCFWTFLAQSRGPRMELHIPLGLKGQTSHASWSQSVASHFAQASNWYSRETQFNLC